MNKKVHNWDTVMDVSGTQQIIFTNLSCSTDCLLQIMHMHVKNIKSILFSVFSQTFSDSINTSEKYVEKNLKKKMKWKKWNNDNSRVSMTEERSQHLSKSHSPELKEVREECFQGLEPHPTRALLRMHQNTTKWQAGHVSTQASTIKPVHLKKLPMPWWRYSPFR